MKDIIKHQREMSRIAGAIITVGLLCCTVSSGNQCPKQKLCQCKFYGKVVDLRCIGTTDLIEMKECLRENFRNFTIRTLYVKPCNATSLPAEFIQNITVKAMYMYCPLSNFSDDAFVDSYFFFTRFRLYNHRLTVIPDAFASAAQLQLLWITNGTLESVGDQLKHLDYLRILFLERNMIRYVSPDAFSSMILLSEIYLSFNQIKEMDANMFSRCRGINKFYLHDNYLSSAEGLLDFINPKVINLRNNNLTDIHIFHPNMWRTAALHLDGNPVGKIDSSVFRRYLLNVLSLDLSNMSLSDVSEEAFTAFPLLTTLNLCCNQIENVHRKTFYNLKSMKELSLSHNNLTSINGIFRKHYKLSKLDISFNRIEDLGDSLSEVPNLDELFVTDNNIKALTDEIFILNVGLRVIFAPRNNIFTLSKYCFIRQQLLEEIQLSSNNIASLNGSIRNMPNLRKVYLAYNRIEILEDDDFASLPSLSLINLMENQLTALNGQFKYLRNLEYLNLENNRIITIGRNVFLEVVPVRAIFLKGNPLSCDCRLEWLSLLSRKYRALKDDAVCQAPHWLKGRYFRNVSVSEFEDWKESCPRICKCHCLPNGSELGIRVDCSRRNLTEVPETLPTKTIGLNLSNNNITVVRRPSLNGTWFDNLQELDIENNEVTAVEGLRSLRYLSILKLANNSLETIAVGERSNFTQMTLSGNPWLCDCSTLWFRSWMLSFKDKITDVNETMCGKGNVKEEHRDTPIIYLSESDICPRKIALYIFISIGILAFLLFVTSSSFTYFRYRLNIKVWLYAHGFSCVKEEEIDKDKPFDAFVSFSSRDEEFVYRILSPRLENDTEVSTFLTSHQRRASTKLL